MVDNREIIIDRRMIAFLCQHKEATGAVSVIAFKLPGARPVVVKTPLAELNC